MRLVRLLLEEPAEGILCVRHRYSNGVGCDVLRTGRERMLRFVSSESLKLLELSGFLYSNEGEISKRITSLVLK